MIASPITLWEKETFCDSNYPKTVHIQKLPPKESITACDKESGSTRGRETPRLSRVGHKEQPDAWTICAHCCRPYDQFIAGFTGCGQALLLEGSVLGSQIGLHIINLSTKCCRCEFHALLASFWYPLDVGLCGVPRQNRREDDKVDTIHTMKAHRGRSIAPINLNIDITCRQVVKFKSQPNYTLEKTQVPTE